MIFKFLVKAFHTIVPQFFSHPAFLFPYQSSEFLNFLLGNAAKFSKRICSSFICLFVTFLRFHFILRFTAAVGGSIIGDIHVRTISTLFYIVVPNQKNSPRRKPIFACELWQITIAIARISRQKACFKISLLSD